MAVKLAAGRDSPRALLGDAVTYYARLGGSTAYALYWVRGCVEPHERECAQCGAGALLVGVRGGGPAAVAHDGRLRRQRHQRQVLAVVALREIGELYAKS